jgi:hypothetical protein
MDDGEKPEGARHLFFGKISAGHMHHCFPVRAEESWLKIYMYQTMYEYNVFLPLPNEKLITFVPSFIT